MRILISGSHGLVGSHLIKTFDNQHFIGRLRRPGCQRGQNDVFWDPQKHEIDQKGLEGWDVVIHLAGENIAEGRWTQKKKDRIYHSRVDGTQFLTESLSQCKNPPKKFLCASAIGFYGNRGTETLNEKSPEGKGFLPETCRAWERAAQGASKKGIDVLCLRLGVVLSRNGGALPKMLLPFKLGAGGKIGNGSQYMSWIAIDDLVGAIDHLIKTPDLRGPVNLVAPAAVTNWEFTKTLGKVLRRPTIMPLPGFMAKILMGEMAEDLLLASTRVSPDKLTELGYSFKFPHLESALTHIIRGE